MLLALASPARAEDVLPTAPRPFAYGILVGSNVGGPGQETLRYAEDDARRLADVLRDLGGTREPSLRVLTRPSAHDVLAALDDVAAKLRAHKERGEQAVFYFYYSGHAHASAMNLAGEELAVADLRQRLLALPSTLTVVVLDACQSGAFARTKGAEPAADFSYNSVARLTTQGVAVMASSSAQELSQESEELRSSYFTHYLIVGLRGAGDSDGDGKVSLDEAYRYAYRRTLAATSRTQVGGQHVTLETDLAGRGDVPLTYPIDARSRLVLPAALDGRVLVTQKGSGAVMAEVQKASGSEVRLALLAGRYQALVRGLHGASQCDFTLDDGHSTSLDDVPCMSVRDTPTTKKGGEAEGPYRREVDRWQAELGLGLNFETRGSYTDRLGEFGYQRQTGFIDTPSARLALAVSREFLPNLAGVVSIHTLTHDSYERHIGTERDRLRYDGFAGTAMVRAQAYVVGSWLGVYGEAGLGAGLGHTTFTTTGAPAPALDNSDSQWGIVLGGAAGIAFRFPHYLTLIVQGGYEYAPLIKNLIGDTLDAGGPSMMLGFRFRAQ